MSHFVILLLAPLRAFNNFFAIFLVLLSIFISKPAHLAACLLPRLLMRISNYTGARTSSNRGSGGIPVMTTPYHHSSIMQNSSLHPWSEFISLNAVAAYFSEKPEVRKFLLNLFFKSKEDTITWSLSSKCAEKSGDYKFCDISFHERKKTVVSSQVQYSLRYSQGFFSYSFFLYLLKYVLISLKFLKSF